MADSTKLALIMGARNGAIEEREENDFYATEPRALEIFLDNCGFKLSPIVWENACGNGGLCEVLKNRGHNVFATDLVDRGYSSQNITKDFFEFDMNWDGDILTNPPYKLAKEFVSHSLELVENGRKVIMFLKIQFLESANRYKELFSKNPPKYVYVHSSRVNCAKHGDFEKYKSATLCYCWFVWEKGFDGEPIIRWLP